MSNLAQNIENQKQSVLAIIKANLNAQNLTLRGLAQLCNVAHTSIVRGGAFNSSVLAETLTQHGFECGALIKEGFNAQATWLVIEYFAFHSKAQAEGAKQLARTFGSFGIHQIFSELSQPQQPTLSEQTRQLELHNQVLEKELALRQLDHTMLTMHGKEVVLALRGKEDQIVEVERKTIEVIDEQHNVKFTGQTLTQVKEELARRFGVKFKSGAEIKRFLEQIGESGLIAQTKRSVVSDYVPKENLESLYQVLATHRQQKLLGE